MSAIPKPHKLTTIEYLAIEEKAEFKSEYYNGEMFATAGANEKHNFVNENLVLEVGSRLKGGPCRTVSRDMRMKVEETGLYTYPDMMIFCGKPEYDSLNKNTLINPAVVFEVLSQSSENYDRGAKFRMYQKRLSIREIVLVSQDQPLIQVFTRQPDETWLLTTFDDMTGNFSLLTLPVSVPMVDVYRDVEFASQESSEPERQ